MGTWLITIAVLLFSTVFTALTVTQFYNQIQDLHYKNKIMQQAERLYREVLFTLSIFLVAAAAIMSLI